MVTVYGELWWPAVVATIKDRGRWRLLRGGSRGRGSRIMRHCTDDVLIDHGPTGATVVICRCLIEEAA